MANVNGLRPVQSQRPVPKYDRGTRSLLGGQGQAQSPSLRPAASPVSTYSAPPVPSQDQRLAQLADALAELNPSLKRFGMQDREAVEREQMMKLPAYIEQVKRDRGTGLITAAQVGEVLPETVPTIRNRISQAVGEEHGAAQFAPVIEEILTNENIRLDTEARKTLIEAKRQEFFGALEGADDFFKAGAVTAFDKAVAAHELNWQRETAQYHVQTMQKQWQREVEEKFLYGGPQALLDLDREWKDSGGLSNETRNSLLIDAIGNLAYSQGNPGLLDQIPDRFLNRETKGLVAEAKAKIEENWRSQVRWGIQMESYEREKAIREGKTQALNRFFNGDIPKPGEYRNFPEVEDYVNTLLNRPRIDPVESEANARRITTKLMEASTTGDLSPLGISGSQFNEESLINLIQESDGLNPQDAVKLINEVPKLLQGMSLLRDDDVRQQLGDRLRPYLDQLQQSLPGKLSAALGGRSLYGVAMKQFQDDLRRSFLAYYEETGEWPKGFQKRDLIDASVQRTEDYITRMQQLGKQDTQAQPGKPTEDKGTGEFQRRR